MRTHLPAGKIAGNLFGVTVIARVRGGVIELPPGTQLPEGAEVRIIAPDPAAASPAPEGGALGWMLPHAGVVEGLPEDFADEHDHYIHGTPRRRAQP